MQRFWGGKTRKIATKMVKNFPFEGNKDGIIKIKKRDEKDGLTSNTEKSFEFQNLFLTHTNHQLESVFSWFCMRFSDGFGLQSPIWWFTAVQLPRYYSAYCFSLFAWLGLFLRLNRTSELHYFRIQAVALFFSRTMMMMLISPSNQKHYCKWKLFSFLTFAVIRFCAHFIEIMMRIFWWLYRIE